MLIFCSCKIHLRQMPLSDIDFKSDEWLFVYVERAYPDTGNAIDRVWMLDDGFVIDSLKREYKCALNKQSDGPQECILYMYKNRKYYDWLVYNDRKFFTFGALLPRMVPVTVHLINCKDSLTASIKIDSLNKRHIKNICYPDLDIPYKYRFSLKLPFSNVNDSVFKTKIEKRKWGTDFPSKAKEEFLKLYPELKEDQVYIYGAGYYYQADIHCHKNFVFDESKLKENKIIRFYEIIGYEEKPYTIECFIKN